MKEPKEGTWARQEPNDEMSELRREGSGESFESVVSKRSARWQAERTRREKEDVATRGGSRRELTEG
jgi:hypothetical protein